MHKLYDIIFQDGTKFEGGTAKSTKWMEMPNKPIKTLTYYHPKMILENYDAFYHCVECATDLNGEKAGISNLEYSYLITRDGEYCEIMKINLKTEHILSTIVGVDSEEILRLNPIGWKMGNNKRT